MYIVTPVAARGTQGQEGRDEWSLRKLSSVGEVVGRKADPRNEAQARQIGEHRPLHEADLGAED